MDTSISEIRNFIKLQHTSELLLVADGGVESIVSSLISFSLNDQMELLTGGNNEPMSSSRTSCLIEFSASHIK